MEAYKIRDIRITFIFFSGILSLLSYKHYPSLLSWLIIALVPVLLFFVIFLPSRLVPLFKKWMQLAHFLGKVNTKILLLLIFILIFIPIGLLKRIFGKDSMQRQLKSAETYWEPYELAGLIDKKRYEKQF